MSELEAEILALREAVKCAPGNTQLVDLLCQALMKYGRYEEAENEYRRTLQSHPDTEQMQLGLANCYYRQKKDSHALAILETLRSRDRLQPAMQVLLARLKYREGEVGQAVQLYQDAIADDESAADEDFASLLGIGAWQDDEAEIVDGRLRAGAAQDAEDSSAVVEIERPRLKFSDVGGMESVKEDIRVKIIYPLEKPELYAAYGQKIGGGILLYGPPGCGKTYLARATAGEVKSGFVSVGISDVLDMWIGNSERNLHEIFESARRSQPCVLFFDEVDALGARRTDMKTSGTRHLINQFLSELDGTDSHNEGLLIVGATNAPWHLDSAFRRPGRFDRIIFVPPPDETARIEILKLHLQGKPQDGLQWDKLARKTEGFSGADLEGVVKQTVDRKLQEAIKTGRPSPITTADLLAVVKKTRPTTGEWFTTAKNHALYSNEGGMYDDILEHLKIKKR